MTRGGTNVDWGRQGGRPGRVATYNAGPTLPTADAAGLIVELSRLLRLASRSHFRSVNVHCCDGWRLPKRVWRSEGPTVRESPRIAKASVIERLIVRRRPWIDRRIGGGRLGTRRHHRNWGTRTHECRAKRQPREGTEPLRWRKSDHHCRHVAIDSATSCCPKRNASIVPLARPS
jgi:hypothetical protein